MIEPDAEQAIGSQIPRLSVPLFDVFERQTSLAYGGVVNNQSA
jgi:hypothetical protein